MMARVKMKKKTETRNHIKLEGLDYGMELFQSTKWYEIRANT